MFSPYNNLDPAGCLALRTTYNHHELAGVFISETAEGNPAVFWLPSWSSAEKSTGPLIFHRLSLGPVCFIIRLIHHCISWQSSLSSGILVIFRLSSAHQWRFDESRSRLSLFHLSNVASRRRQLMMKNAANQKRNWCNHVTWWFPASALGKEKYVSSSYICIHAHFLIFSIVFSYFAGREEKKVEKKDCDSYYFSPELQSQEASRQAELDDKQRRKQANGDVYAVYCPFLMGGECSTDRRTAERCHIFVAFYTRTLKQTETHSLKKKKRTKANKAKINKTSSCVSSSRFSRQEQEGRRWVRDRKFKDLEDVD